MSDVVERMKPTPGAPDTDRPAWLAERRTGITATEIRDLYLGKITIAKLVALKLGRITDSFSGNQYTAWGNEREPVIAAEAERRFGVRPESRVFHAADEYRFLASPDGVGEDFDGNPVISELKTAGMDIAPGTEAYDRKGYYIQKVWGMRVMRALRCLYGWEYRLDTPDGFVPGLLQFQWIEWDARAQKLAAELEVLARKVLAALDAAAGEEYVAPVVDDELDTLAVNLLRFREMEADGKRAKEATWSQLLTRLTEGGAAVSQESALARVTFTPGEDTTDEVLDAQAAKDANPTLFVEVQALSKRWNEHAAGFKKTVTVPGKPHLTVTSVKTKEVK
jgi:hypothetical protein